MSPDHLRELAKTHDDISADINALAPSMPESLDGGDGGPFVTEMLARLGMDAQDLAQLNKATASSLRFVARDTSRTDQEAADGLSIAGD